MGDGIMSAESEIGTGIGIGEISITSGASTINVSSAGVTEVGIDMSVTMTVGDASTPSVFMTGSVDSIRSTDNRAGEIQQVMIAHRRQGGGLFFF